LKTILALSLLFIFSTAFADLKYYPADLSAKIQSHALKNENLKSALNLLTSQNQVVLGYDGARKIMFGKIFLKNDSSGYYINDVYCQKRFGSNAGVAPGKIPEGTKINCEHTWPQSKFTGAYPNEMQKSDLHHLFPTDSRANSIRGNINFTEVGHDTGVLDETNCGVSKFGSSTQSSDDGFEPPLAQKGNTARAIFYFSVRYKMPIPRNEEEVLRRWNDLDPVDQEEMDRNNTIQSVQGNRNPFVDFPSLANDIQKF
jgi:deoxyribonuclease-1